MEIEAGEYVRTNKGNIGKVIGIFEGHCIAKYHIEFQGTVKVKRQYLSTKTIVKHSKNIIDLIEVGDYVNGLLVTRICEDNETSEKYINLFGAISEWKDEDIKSIVTHEQFEAMEYKIEQEEINREKTMTRKRERR